MKLPSPSAFYVTYWLKNWGNGNETVEAADALAAAQQVHDTIKAKWPDSDVQITGVRFAGSVSSVTPTPQEAA